MGKLVISLDFEMLWGVFDSKGTNYRENLRQVRTVVPRLLDLFAEYDVHCTWATVGALMTRDHLDFLAHKPAIEPT